MSADNSREMARRWLEARRKADPANWAVVDFSEAGGKVYASIDLSDVTFTCALPAKRVDPETWRLIVGDPFSEDES